MILETPNCGANGDKRKLTTCWSDHKPLLNNVKKNNLLNSVLLCVFFLLYVKQITARILSEMFLCRVCWHQSPIWHYSYHLKLSASVASGIILGLCAYCAWNLFTVHSLFVSYVPINMLQTTTKSKQNQTPQRTCCAPMQIIWKGFPAVLLH